MYLLKLVDNYPHKIYVPYYSIKRRALNKRRVSKVESKLTPAKHF